jgi:hypothetical protein
MTGNVNLLAVDITIGLSLTSNVKSNNILDVSISDVISKIAGKRAKIFYKCVYIKCKFL